MRTKVMVVALLLTGILLSFFGYPRQVFSQDTLGIGISDYETYAEVNLGQSKIFEIARVRNEGTLPLTVTATWKPDFKAADSDITLRFYPEAMLLNSGEDMLLRGEVVKAGKPGTYKGVIEFSSTADNPQGASLSVPGGTAHVTFAVISTGIDLQLVFITVISAVLIVAVATVILWMRRRNMKQFPDERKKP